MRSKGNDKIAAYRRSSSEGLDVAVVGTAASLGSRRVPRECDVDDGTPACVERRAVLWVMLDDEDAGLEAASGPAYKG